MCTVHTEDEFGILANFWCWSPLSKLTREKGKEEGEGKEKKERRKEEKKRKEKTLFKYIPSIDAGLRSEHVMKNTLKYNIKLVTIFVPSFHPVHA